MLLRRVHIENFRAIRRISLPLDATTVLIGENGCGKTSVFDALRLCLGPSMAPTEFPFPERDFRRRARRSIGEYDPITIRLEFAESEAGEWPESVRKRFEAAMLTERDGCCSLRWEVRARWNASEAVAESEWVFLDAAGRPLSEVRDESLVVELKRLCPFLVLDDDSEPQRAEPGEESASGGVSSAEELLRRRSWNRRELEQATLEIWDKLAAGWDTLSEEDLAAGRAVSAQIWKRVIRRARDERGLDRPKSRERLPSGGAQSLAPLLVFGAFLHAQRADRMHPAGTPILAFEQIEVGLHPSTLGAVWRVLESVPAQKLVSTYSGEMLASAPLSSLRRMVRGNGQTRVYRFDDRRVSRDELRRLRYHIRSRRGGALFDRCWLLVEGETEFWLLPELARLRGYDFESEGVSCVEFAQCGERPILELARSLGIRAHVLVDGDAAGERYAETVRETFGEDAAREIVTRLPALDVENYLWESGYAEVYRAAAGRSARRTSEKPEAVIERAVRMHSKPYLALSVVEACAAKGQQGVPVLLRRTIERVVQLARGG